MAEHYYTFMLKSIINRSERIPSNAEITQANLIILIGCIV